MNKKIFLFLTTLLITTALWSQDYNYQRTSSDSAGAPAYDWESTPTREMYSPQVDISKTTSSKQKEEQGHYIEYDPSDYPSPRQGGDNIGNAIVINALPYDADGTTAGYTNDYDEVCPYTGSTSPDVVYSYTPSSDKVVDISLCGDTTDYDTKLYVYENVVGVLAATEDGADACNDDECSTASFTNSFVSSLTGVILNAGNIYYIVVDGYNGNSGEYNISVTEVETPPDAPQNLTALGDNQQVTLSWSPNSEDDLASYNIYRGSASPAQTLLATVTVTSSPDTAYTDNTVTNDSTYFYRITAVDLDGDESGYSNEVEVTPYNPIPAAPQNLTALGDNQQVTLSWSPNSEDDLASYNIYRGSASPAQTLLATVTVTSSPDTAYTDNTVTNDSTYFYRITAVDLDGDESEYSNEVEVTPYNSIPAAPQNLTALGDNQQVTLSWSPNSEDNLASYNIYRGSTSPAQTLLATVTVTSSPDTTYTDNTVTTDSMYFYRITAVDLDGDESGYSNEVEVTPYLGMELLTNAAESEVSGTNMGYPINSWYHDVKHQSLYWASDLSDAGILSGAIITGIKFKVNQTPGMNLDSVRIAYNWTSSTEISSFDTSTTVVYGPINYVMSDFQENNWIQFNFSSPITWDGVSNLIIEYSHDNNSYVTGGGTYMRHAGNNRARRGWTDSGAGHYPFTSNMTQAPDSKVASIRLIIQETGLQPPTDLIATPSYQQADLNWTASTSDSITHYLLYRGTGVGGVTKIDSVSATTITYSNTGLTNGTTYYFGVKTKQEDGDLSSMSSPVSVTPGVETPANLSAASGSQQVSLTWDAPGGNGVVKALIYQGFNSSGSGASLVDSTSSGTDTTITITGLNNGTEYYFGIKYKGEDNSTSSASNIVGAVPDYLGPAWYVSSSGNNSTGDGSTTAPFATIDYAIDEAAENDTIKLKPGTFTGYGNYNINPEKDLVIMGIGGADSVTIDVGASFNNRYYGFHLYNYTYTAMKIKGLTIVNAFSPDGNGGAIKIQSAGAVEIDDCVIGPGNKAASGAGIYIYDTDVNVSGTTIKGNTAPITYFNDGVNGAGLCIDNNNNNTVNITNCLIRGNSGIASGQGNMVGGGFSISGDNSTTNFINTFIYNNELSSSGTSGYSIYGGGGIIQNGAQVYFVHTDILNNNAENTSFPYMGRGGALWIDGSAGTSAYFLNSIIWGNTASNSDASEQMFGSENNPSIVMNYSAAQMATSGTGNLNEDPEFMNEDNNNYALSLRSGLLGAGATSAMTSIAGASLIPDTDYLGNARPGSGGGRPDFGALENALSESPVPDAPSGLTATAGDGQVVLSWTASSDADVSKYGIYYGTSSGPTVKQQEASTTADTITGLNNNVTYYFRITAIDADDYESSYSDEVTGTPQFSGETIYVNGSATGSEDGSSTNPYHTIQDAIAAESTTDGKRLLVLAGTYTYDSGSGAGTTYSFSYNDSYGPQSGSFFVSENNITSLNFSHSNQALFPSSSWSISYSPPNETFWNDQYSFSLYAQSSENTTFNLSTWNVGIQSSNGGMQGGWDINVQQSSSAATAVIDLQGKNIVLVAVSGSDSTFIDGDGDYTALDMDADNDEYEGYASSTEFIGFTFMDGPDDEPLINIVGPGISSSLDWAPTFTNCRFINSSITDLGGEDHGVIDIEDAEPVFNNCEFRNLSIDPNNSSTGTIKGPIRLASTGYDSTAFRSQFNNCTIAGNYTHFQNPQYSQYDFKGGAVYVGWGALPTFKDCRIDSNEIDTKSGASGWGDAWNAAGGAVYIDGFLSYSSSPVRFINTSFNGNEVTGENVYGGAIASNHPQVCLVNCVVINNKISSEYTDFMNDQNVVALGGGIAFNPDNNSQGGQDDAKLAVINSTIADNEVVPYIFSDTNWQGDYGGAGIYRGSSDNYVLMFNSIVYGNTIDGGSGYNNRLSLSSGGSEWGDDETAIDYSIIEYADSTGLEEDDLMDTDPGFVGNGDYSLAASSVAIGAGIDEYENTDAPAYDYNNSIRPNPDGSDPDLGAFENSLSVTPYPAKPQNLTVDSEGDSTIILSWMANTEDDLAQYKIYYGTSSATTLLDSVSGTPAYTATGLDNYTTYYFAVSAEDLDDYESAKSNEVSGEPKWSGPNWYVDTDNGSSSGDGSPATPFREIQDAIDAVDPLSRTDGLIDTILVLPGAYNRGDDQQLYFKYISGTNEGNPKNLVLKSRDGAATTILDGEGSKRLFEIVDGTDTTLQIIGFTITNGGENDGMGNAVKVEGQFYWDPGSNQNIELPSGVTFKNCIFTENGTLENTEEPPVIYLVWANVRFEDCIIKDNHVTTSNASADGGAISANDGSELTVVRTKILDNSLTTSSDNASGAGIYMGASDINQLTVINSIIARNTATAQSSFQTSKGAGISVFGGKATIINSTIVDNINIDQNQFENGAGIYVTYSNSGNSTDLNLFNSIIYGNTPIQNQLQIDGWLDIDHYVSYSLLQGVDINDFEDGVFEANPEFADNTYVLHERSPAIGAGETEGEDTEGEEIYAPADDLAGNVRPNPAGSNPDLGAYEHELAVTPYPSTVSNLIATPLHRSVQLDWLYAEDEDVEMYIAYMGEDSITFTPVDTVLGRFNTRTTIDSLDNGTDYWFYVTAVDTADYESSPTLHVKTSPFFQGPVWIVSADDGTSNGEGSPEEPMKYIKDAIEEAADGDTIMLMPGTYDHSKNRNLNFQDSYDGTGVRNLTLMGKYGADTTFIDLDGHDFIDFIGNEDNSSKISGLTIQNSASGAVDIWNASPEIENCIFLNNQNNQNGGAINIQGTNGDVVSISNTLFDGNSIQDGSFQRGGAIHIGNDDSKAYVENCIFYNNSADEMGGGINQDNNSNLVIVQSLFLNNTTNANWGAGGVNSFAAEYGGNTTIINSIFAGNANALGSTESDVYSSNGYPIDVDHCILQSTNSATFNYGENFAFEPLINDTTNGDFSLNEFSDAIGLGTDEYYNPISDNDENMPATDFNGDARPGSGGGKPDIGAIEHERWEQRRKVFYLATDGDDGNDGLSADSPLLSLAEAFNKSVIRDTIELAAGTYSGTENRDLLFNGVDRIIRSTDGAASTIIDCENQGHAFVLENGETDSTIISGITIQNGSSDYGGAVDIDGADPIFEGVIFKNNYASVSGGAVYANDSDAELINCVFTGNSAAESAVLYANNSDIGMDFITAVGNQGDDDVSFSGNVHISNSILWGNSPVDDAADVTYSDVMGGNADTGNYNGRPGFVDGFNGDFNLQDWSPVIGQADDSTGVLVDVNGNARPVSGPDMGAYENSLDTASTYTSQQWYVSTTGSDSARIGMGSESDPFGSIQYAMNHAIYDDEVRIKPGFYNEYLNNWNKDILIVGDGASHPNNDVSINGSFDISGGSPELYDLHLINESNVLQINNDAVVTLYNLLITDSDYSGLSINDSAVVYMINLTIYGNATGIYDNSTGTVSAVNSIIWNNTAATYGTPTITYSDVEDGYTGTGNIDSDPDFVAAENGDFNLQITSPCIDAGDSTYAYDSDSTVTDMGAFPLIREFLTDTSAGNIVVTDDESAVITNDFTLNEDDTLFVEPGADVYFDPGVTLTIDGVMAASGEAGNPVTFLCTDPDSTYGGVIINTGTGTRDEVGDEFSYLLIQDVEAAFIPLTINGDATIDHITIAGNENNTSLEVNIGTVALNYSILEGSTSGSGTINYTGTDTSNTGQFVNYDEKDFTLLPTAGAIDLDTTGMYIDPDYTFADAGCFYHDQAGYPVTSITVHRPAFGDTILVSPDTSSVTGSISKIQLFNAYDRYKTNGVVSWNNGNAYGSFITDFTNTTDLDGMISNIYVTNTIAGTHNSFSVTADGVTSTSGEFLVEPGIPDSVWVNEQTEMNMTQLDVLTFSASVYDQFANLVTDGETVAWSIDPVTGNGEGFTLSASTSSTSSGSVSVTLATDPTGNSLSVGDQVTVQAVSGNGVHQSALVTIIPDDIYNLTMPTELTEAQIDISADVATVYIEAALIDTFDNALEGVEVNWEVVTGSGTGESLSASSTFTNVNGIAWVDLNTSTVSNSDYTVRGWVTENALFSVLMGTNRSGQNSDSGTGIMLNQKSGNTKSDLMNIRDASTLISLPVRISNNTPDENNLNRDNRSVYDLDDTTAVIHVVPGVTEMVSLPPDSVDVLLGDQFQITANVFDQFGNTVADGTPVTWEILPANNYISIVNSDNASTGGDAMIELLIEQNAPWDFDFVVNLTSESITGSTGTYNIDDVTAPDPISDLAINPDVWTSTNDFTLSWSNPYDHAGVFGAHVSIDGDGDSFTEEQNITSLSGLMLPSNALSTFDVWLEDNAGNDEAGNAVSIVAKWDDTNPNAFTVTYPLVGWYNQQFLDFEWNASSDATAGLKYYEVTINSTNNYQQHPDSTQMSIPDGFAEGAHQWTITVYDSAGNATETSNPQTINIDFTNPVIAHNPVLEGSENAPVTITATFDDPMSGINIAELYYRKGGEVQWQAPVDMKTLNTYQIASSFVTSVGVEYYIYSRDVAGNETYKPAQGHYSISVTIPGAGLSSTDRWPTGIPNGSAVSSYQIISFPGQAANATPTDLLVDDLLAYDDTKWRFFTYSGGAWNEFAAINTIDPGVGYFLIVKDAGFNITTGQTRSVTTDDDFIINFTSGEWVMLGNPFDFSIPLENVTINDSTNLAADPNFYTYDGANGWVSANKLDPWKGYVYKSTTANQLKIIPRKSNGGLKIANSEIVLLENEWLVDISARNGLGVDKINTVGVLTTANDEYDALDAFEPPMLPGGVSLRIDNRNWAQNGDTYTTDIRSIKEEGEFWDMEIAAEDDRHNVYVNFEGLADIPAEFDVFIIDVTLGVAQDLRWKPIYRYAVSNPKSIHDIRFIAGTKEFVQENNAGVELYPDRFSISQNYPNPFNPQTSILITLEDVASVDLIVYNLLGEEVIRISDSELYPAGYHNFIWKGLNQDGKRVASGVYFYMTRIRNMSGKTILNQTNKMIMVK